MIVKRYSGSARPDRPQQGAQRQNEQAPGDSPTAADTAHDQSGGPGAQAHAQHGEGRQKSDAGVAEG